MIFLLIFPTVNAIIRLRDSLQYQQNNQSVTFQYTPNQADSDKYIFFELRISNIQEGQSQLFMACQLNVKPSYQSAMYADLNANYENLTYHNILIQPLQNQNYSNDSYFITIFIPNNTTYLYTLAVSINDNPPCPNNCSNQKNACQQGICDCQQNFLDLDCSKKGIELTLNNVQTVIVNGFSYLYYQINNNQSAKLQFSISQSQIIESDVTAYLFVEDLIHGVPNLKYFSQVKQMTTSDMTFIIDTREIKYINQLERYQRIILSIYGPWVQILQIQAKIVKESSGDNRLNILLTCSGVALLLVIAAIIIYFFKCRAPQNARVQGVQVSNLQDLNIQIIDQYMPMYQYYKIFEMTQFKRKQINKQKSDQCSVCLIEFEDDNYVRFCPCLHIFHSKCLELWLLKHKNCPNCRLEINYQQLQKYELELKCDLDQKKQPHNQQIPLNNFQIDEYDQHELILNK